MISFFSIYLVAKIAFLALRISKICLRRRRFLCGDRGSRLLNYYWPVVKISKRCKITGPAAKWPAKWLKYKISKR